MKFHIFFILVLVCTSGCVKKKPIIVMQENFQQTELLAKYADIPDAPFQLQLQSIATHPDDQDQVQMFYTSAMPIDELGEYYQQQMERLGWELFAESHAQDWLLHYTKPTRISSVLITEKKLALYLGNKKGA